MTDSREPKVFKRTEILSEYINQEDRDNYLKKIERAEGFINCDLKQAITAEGLVFDIDLVNTLRKSPDAIEKIIAKHKQAYINTQSFLPTKEKQRIESNYNEVTERLLDKNNTLYYSLEPYKYKLVETKDKEIVFDKKEVDAHVLTLGIRILNSKELEYIALLQDAAEILTKAYNMEVSEGYVPYALGMVIPFNGTYLYQGFARDVDSDSDFVKKLTDKSTFKTALRVESEKNQHKK